MRVLHIIPGYGGGISSYVINLLKSLQTEENIIIDTASYTDFPHDFKMLVAKKAGKCFRLPSIYGGLNKFLKTYFNILKEGNYDMVHCHIPGIKGLPFTAGAKLMGIKRIVIHAHSTNEETNSVFSGFIKKCNRISNKLFITDRVSCGKKASEFIFGNRISDSGKIEYMPNVVDIDNYMKIEKNSKFNHLRNELNIPLQATVIGHIGRFNFVKNHEFMIEIIKCLVNNGYDFIWCFVGDGELFKNFKDKIEQSKLDKYVRILGRRKDIAQLMNLMDVVVLPSFFEGVPTVAIEAQTAGKPVLLSDTITKEANMGMGLLKYLPLHLGADIWAKAIINKKGCCVIGISERCDILESKGYTLKGLEQKYKAFVSLN